ncbi:MAG: hypothetical protein NXI07_15410 [bacterium]|nr:hypothetical protein [bacterium]
MDLLEGFAGEAACTKLAPQYGLTAMQLCDYRSGWSLGTPEGRHQWKHAVTTFRPRLISMAVNCTEWTVLNYGMRYTHRAWITLVGPKNYKPAAKPFFP